MDRTPAARLSRPLGIALPLPRRVPRPALPRALRLRGRMRTVAIALALGICLLAGAWMVVRHTSLSAVEHVRVRGLSGPQAASIEAALVGTARGMSTLGVDDGALAASVAQFPIVGAVHASSGFPHDLVITVVEQPAVAALLAGGARTAVAADGVVLGPALLTAGLPTLDSATLPITGARVSSAALRGALAILGGAPAALRVHVVSLATGQRGLAATMQNGLIVYFGDATLPHAKWLALATVLADPKASGARYVDVRIPARPAVGFAPGAGPAATTASGEGSTSASAGTSESTISALAANLASGSGAATGGQHEPPPGSAAAKEAQEHEAAAASGAGETGTAGTEGG